MGDFVEFSFDDDTSVLMEVFPVPGGLLETSGGSVEESFPGVTSQLTPVGRTADAIAKAGQTLEDVLRPLVPALQAVHRTVLRIPHAPDEVTVTLGVRLANSLQLGIVGGRGEASLTIAATWRTAPAVNALPILEAPESGEDSAEQSIAAAG
jgi:hypothetical protein